VKIGSFGRQRVIFDNRLITESCVFVLPISLVFSWECRNRGALALAAAPGLSRLALPHPHGTTSQHGPVATAVDLGRLISTG